MVVILQFILEISQDFNVMVILTFDGMHTAFFSLKIYQVIQHATVTLKVLYK